MSQRALVSRGRLLCKIHHFQHVIPRFLNAQFLVFSTQFIVFNAKFLTVSSSKARHRCSRRGACRCTRARYYPHQRTPQRSARRSNAEGTAYLELQNKWPFFNKISSFSGKFSIISAFSIEKIGEKLAYISQFATAQLVLRVVTVLADHYYAVNVQGSGAAFSLQPHKRPVRVTSIRRPITSAAPWNCPATSR